MGIREQTRELVLEAAESLFLAKGLLEVSMEDIAAKASCTRRNLYRYFDTKEALTVAVLRKLIEPWNTFQEETFRLLRGSGLTGRQELSSFLETLTRYLEIHKDLIRFSAEFDFLFRDHNAFQLDLSSERSMYAEFQVTEKLIVQILEKGEIDGSLRLPSPPSIIVPTITTVLWALGQRVALRENLIRIEFGIDGMTIIQNQIDLIILALTPTKEPEIKEEN
ncbi:TetR/AcrR family transcriptional regulator [Leptospira haakeii]|uniref:TetR family transcriptional regulator n=1 Tax=Leptospira haakeii TaxID=2023198 RepID=A0ABX4PQ01_9LEPT|nr:TetR/AcrR family transcriptional regulator [Leptospira haakeii]PKA16129.1 TetR family transcriptional regulator [Leptospira haakeii]PKA19229.1 TetR family transcriptional regulator [Leptospira haakeii]